MLQTVLPNVYTDFSKREISIENERVFYATKIERDWINDLDLCPYEDLEDILTSINETKLDKVEEDQGYRLRHVLANWTIENDNPFKENYYSPPYLKSVAAEVMKGLFKDWDAEFDGIAKMSLTSLVRHREYQKKIAMVNGKIATDPRVGVSSHLVGQAFDIDGSGLYIFDEDSNDYVAINPNQCDEQDYQKHFSLIEYSRNVIRGLLESSMEENRLNFVEELPGTKQHCFHVCVNPHLQVGNARL